MTRIKSGRPRITKKAQLIRMLSSKTGTDVVAVGKKLGWQNHSTRAALTSLRRAGYMITTERRQGDKPTRYRITAAPIAENATQAEATLDAG